jgi:arsenate reductase
MAEAIANQILGGSILAKSAGSKPGTLVPQAVQVMAEIGIDVSGHRPLALKDLKGERFDFAVTLCQDSEEICPFYPEADQYLHHGVNDPPGIGGTEQERLQAYRQMRDDIKAFVLRAFGS